MTERWREKEREREKGRERRSSRTGDRRISSTLFHFETLIDNYTTLDTNILQ